MDSFTMWCAYLLSLGVMILSCIYVTAHFGVVLLFMAVPLCGYAIFSYLAYLSPPLDKHIIFALERLCIMLLRASMQHLTFCIYVCCVCAYACLCVYGYVHMHLCVYRSQRLILMAFLHPSLSSIYSERASHSDPPSLATRA